ncbi:ABC transporter ATP-binding protein [Actinomycetaceae bacterium MB13-C1-2]|nr:ABC transporter ATP-binding protein [Actinomycetaceae bacterium MB13-C1-2]
MKLRRPGGKRASRTGHGAAQIATSLWPPLDDKGSAEPAVAEVESILPDAEPVPQTFDGPLVKLVDVTRIFPGPPAVQALRNVNLEVEKGEYLAIIGPSGSGKSTMLNTLGLLDRPSSGLYEFDGVDVSGLSDDERADLRGGAIGFVFQSFHLLPTRTVLDNVILSTTYAGFPREEREKRARDALDRVGMGHRLDFYPGTLSGGERQRVALARAVATSPRLLLADEPTGNLDRANSEGVMQLFEELSEDGLTIIMITHDSAVAQSAHRRVQISDGQLSRVA